MAAPDRTGWRRIAIWDGPVRLVHWAIALAFAALWWTGETGRMEWHVRVGIVLLGLVVFRVLWGLVGSSTARFASFVRGPATVLRYATSLVRREGQGFVVGHNPMGGWSILALLTLLAAEVALGLFAVDVDGLQSGPWAAKVSFDQGRWAAGWHHTLFNGLLALVALHLAAVAFYLVLKRENLIAPMLRGTRLAPPSAEPMRAARLWRIAICLLGAFVAMGLAWKPPV